MWHSSSLARKRIPRSPSSSASPKLWAWPSPISWARVVVSVRRIRVNGRWVWQARVAFKGHRTSAICSTREGARQAEARLLQRLQIQNADAHRIAMGPAIMKALFEGYVADLEARGKAAETSGRAAQTVRVVEQVLPD